MDVVDGVVVEVVVDVDDMGTGGVKGFSDGLGSVHTKCEHVYNEAIHSIVSSYGFLVAE